MMDQEKSEDMAPQQPSSAALLFVGTFIFPALFAISKAFWMKTPLGQKWMKQLQITEPDVIDISNKIVSLVQSLTCAIAGFIVCLNCSHDVLSASHSMTVTYAYFGIPYFYYDTISMFYVYRSCHSKNKNTPLMKDFIKFFKSSYVMVLHHVLLVPTGFYIVAYGRGDGYRGDFFAGIVYMMEASTPFVSVRAVLSRFKMKSSLAYLVNGICMLITFFLFRIFSVLWTVGLYSQQNNVGYMQTLFNLPIQWKLAFVAALGPQVYWYIVMWQRVLETVRPGKVVKEQKKE